MLQTTQLPGMFGEQRFIVTEFRPANIQGKNLGPDPTTPCIGQTCAVFTLRHVTRHVFQLVIEHELPEPSLSIEIHIYGDQSHLHLPQPLLHMMERARSMPRGVAA